MLPRSIVHQEIMRRLFLPDNITPSQVEEYTARLCSPEFRKAFDTLCQLDQVATDESDKENGNETDRILSQIAAKADMLENPDIGLDQLDEQGDFEPDPRLEGIIEHLRDTFFEDVDYGEPAEQQEGENGENAEEGVAAAIEQDVNAVNEGDNNATNNMNVNINANASANAVAAKLLDMGNEGGLDDETVAEVFQFQEIQEETERLRQKYAEGLKQLQDMGYTDEGQNLMVLDARNGDVAAAIEFLIVDE